ncbi:MAG: SDR family NAD(P)-dependent oxidoreductase [Anaerolineae bacterium]
MMQSERPGAVALITGASSGIGAAFARRLAAAGYDLVLVARRGDRLAALADELAQAHRVQAEPLPADLTTDADVARVADRIAALPALELLINNAGFGAEGRFALADLDPQLDMIRLHVLASVRLTRAALPGMIARGRGGIINVASLAGFMALPRATTYCATKGYLITFSRALRLELRGTGVRVQALCPGFTRTEFHARQSSSAAARLPGFLWMSADAVAEASLRALARGQTICIPGWGNRLLKMLGASPLADWILPHVATDGNR